MAKSLSRWLLVAVLGVTGWSDAAELDVFVTILPQKFLVERVGGERVRAEVLVPPGQSPETAAMTPRQLTRLAQANLFFRIGMPFENALLPKLATSMPNLKVVDTRKGIELRRMTEAEAEAHDHDHDHDHDHGHHHHHDHDGHDPHIWLSPLNAKIMAKTMQESLTEADPAGAAFYEQNYQALIKELDEVHAELQEKLAPIKGEIVLVFHPAFGYFTDLYGLKQVAVETGGKEPTARQMARLIQLAREQNVHVIFVQPQFASRTARTIATSISGAVVPLDPLSENYISNLREIGVKVAEGVAKPRQ